MVTTFGLRRLWRCVMVLLVVVASLAVATPGVRANDAGGGQVGPTISGLDEKTDVKTTDKGVSYKLGKAKVNGKGSKTLTVSVNSGWFTIPNWKVGGVEPAVALNAEEKLLTSWRLRPSTLNNERYRHIEFNVKGQPHKTMSAQTIQQFLQGMTLYFTPGEPQTMWVSATYDQLLSHRTTRYDGPESYDAHLFNGNAYSFITAFDPKFETGYSEAQKTLFLGKPGYLMTIDSEGEHNAIYHALGEGFGWVGGTNAVDQRTAKANGPTITLGTPGEDWYWVSGPKAGTKFWSNGQSVPGVYANWAGDRAKGSDRPNASSKLCCVRYGWSGLAPDDGGKWVPLTSKGTHHDAESNIIRGYYAEFEGFDPRLAGQVTMSAKMVTIGSTLREVSSSNTATSMLSHTQYETKLTTHDGREMDLASVKVTVDGVPLNVTDYSFDKSTGTLTVPAAKVSGNLHVHAAAKRLVRVEDGLTSKHLGTVQVPNNTPVDKTALDRLAGTRSGYRLTGYTTQDGTPWDFSNPVTADLTLKTQHELNAPTVSFFPPDPRLDRTGASVMLYASSQLDGVPGARFTYEWSKNGTPIDGGTGGSLQVSEEGTYMVAVTAMDPNTDRTSHATGTVEVKPPHQWQVTLRGQNGFSWLVKQLTVINGDKLNRDALNGQVALPGYIITGYTKPDGAPWLFETEVREHTTLYPQYQMITPKVTVSADRPRLESPGDKSTLTVGVSTQVPGATFTYRWIKNGKPITDATGQKHQADEPGDYTVEVTVTDPRTGVSAKGTASVTVTASDKYQARAAKKPDAKKALVDTGLAVSAPAVALMLMLAIAGTLAALRRRNK